MSASTFTRCCGLLACLPPSFLTVIFASYCWLLFSMLTLGISSNSLTLAQSVKPLSTSTSGGSLNEQYPSTIRSVPLNPTTTTLTTIAVPAINKQPPTTSNSSIFHQPKSLKFTLIAGKLWRFNIKPNSFSNYKEGELRLHRNVSTNNYIIDDDGWFQYNPQQQQLFAWPSLAVKSGTYNFVLLPSGVDFEADSENAVVEPEVAANIIVELIPPLYPNPKGDIDQLIDHKFSLEYLHRHQNYTLLLSQIVAVLNSVAGSNSDTAPSNLSQQLQTTTNPPAITTISAFLAQQRGPKVANKLADYLLISSNYSAEGDLFSLTWAIHPLLFNNTITKISDCRLTVINDIVTKLSTRASGYQKKRDQFDIYYPLEPTIVNSALVPTERGENALKLTLNGPCQSAKIIEELGVASTLDDRVVTDDKDGVELQASSTQKAISSTTSHGTLAPEAINSNTASQPSATTSPTTKASAETSALVTTAIALNVSETTSQEALRIAVDTTTKSTLYPTAPSIVNKTVQKEPQVIKSEILPVLQQPQQTKSQPQAKSFATFLDSTNEVQNPNSTMATTILPKIPNNISENSTYDNLTNNNNLSVEVVPTKDARNSTTFETSLNEDLISILDDIMNYLISVAVPVSIIIGIILFISIVVAICSLCIKKKKSKQFQVRNRFDFRYGSERRGFLKNSSKPVILDADQKSLSMGGTPQHRATSKEAASNEKKKRKKGDTGAGNSTSYFPLNVFSGGDGTGQTDTCAHVDSGAVVRGGDSD